MTLKKMWTDSFVLAVSVCTKHRSSSILRNVVFFRPQAVTLPGLTDSCAILAASAVDKQNCLLLTSELRAFRTLLIVLFTCATLIALNYYNQSILCGRRFLFATASGNDASMPMP